MNRNSKPAKVTLIFEDSPIGVQTRFQFEPPCDLSAHPDTLTPAQSVGVSVLGHLFQNHQARVAGLERPTNQPDPV